MRRAAWLVLGLLALVTAGPARATDIPITGLKLIVVDKTFLASKAKAVFVAKDAMITKGPGTDPMGMGIEATLNVAYDAVSGTFLMPAGSNWLVNSASVGKYVNKAAPTGGAVKVGVIKPGSLLKVVAGSLGDVALDISSAPAGNVYVAATIVNEGDTTRLCTQFAGCVQKLIAGGTGYKLICKGNASGDATCAATTACNPADPNCGSTTTTTLTSTTTTVPNCVPTGSSCAVNSDCCSNSCVVVAGAGQCQAVTTTSTSTSTTTSLPSCGADGSSCVFNSDCCSNNCVGSGISHQCQAVTTTSTSTSTTTSLPSCGADGSLCASNSDCCSDNCVVSGFTHQCQAATTTSTSTTSTTTSSTTTTTLCAATSGTFCDLGDGTVYDSATHLQWEKKTTAVGSGVNAADLHDVDNSYRWAGYCSVNTSKYCQPTLLAETACKEQTDTAYWANGCEPCSGADGTCTVSPAITTVWDWLGQVNAANYAGHSDWRLPSESGCNSCAVSGACTSCSDHELETILLSSYPCGTSPCIDSIFGPTASDWYWSASTYTAVGGLGPAAAWGVYVGDGSVLNGSKTFGYYVRAVRGGF